MANGGAHIGDLVWPEVRLGDTKLERSDLATWLDEAGLPLEWAPPEPSGQKAFGRALSHCRNLEAAPNISIERESLRSRVALVRHHTGSGLEKSTSTWARISVSDFDELETEWSSDSNVQDAIDGTVSSTVLAHAKVAIATLTAEHERHLRFTDSQELGSMVTTVVQHHLGGIRIRRDGGLYFVSAAEGNRLRAFASVVRRAGDSRLPFMPAFDSAEGRANLGQSVSDTLHSEVQSVVEGLKKLGSEAKGPRESSLKRRLDELDALSNRAETCRILLSDYSAGIHKAVEAAKGSVLSMMELS